MFNHRCRKYLCVLAGLTLLLVSAGTAPCEDPAPRTDYLNKVETQVAAYLSDLSDLHCTEKVTQQKLNAKGHVISTERSQYDYLVMIMGDGNDFNLNESRREISADKHKNSDPPMLITNGIATVLLVFHPYYRNSFEFSIGPQEAINDHPAVPVSFRHIPGRRTPLALSLRSREYPVELTGTAWLDRESGAILRIEAHLQQDMIDVGLKSMNFEVNYAPVGSLHVTSAENLPAEAVIDVSTPRQHWRNTHVFENYRAFSADAVQDPNVVVKPQAADPNVPANSTPNAPKENQ